MSRRRFPPEEFRLEAYPLGRVMCENRRFLHNPTSADYLVYPVSTTTRSVNHSFFVSTANAYFFVIVLNACRHARLIQQGRILFTVFSENHIAVETAEILQTTHVEHFTTTVRLSFLLSFLNGGKERRVSETRRLNGKSTAARVSEIF